MSTDNSSTNCGDLQPALIGDSYRSQNGRTPFIKRLFPSNIFYTRLLHIFCRASRLAKQGKYDNTDCNRDTHQIFRCLEDVGIRFEIENMTAFKNLNTPCVFIGNHMSSLETFILPAILLPNRNVVCVVYKGILKWPVFKDILPSLNPIVVSKTSPREDLTHVLSKGHKSLKQDASVIVFPQGARMTEFRTEDFSSIGVKLAKHAEVPVIPIAIKSDAWGKDGFPITYFGKIDPAKTVRISFGDPLYITGNGKQEHDLAVNFIQDKLTSWENGDKTTPA